MYTIRSEQKKQLRNASTNGKSVHCTCPRKSGGPSEEEKKKGLNIEINIYDVFNSQLETDYPNHLKLFKNIKSKIYLDTGVILDKKIDDNGRIILKNVHINNTFKVELIQPPVAYDISQSSQSISNAFVTKSMADVPWYTFRSDEKVITIIENLSDRELASLDYHTKKQMIKSLEDGYTGDPELTALKRIYKSYNVQKDADLLEYAINATVMFTADNRAILIVNAISNQQLAELPLSTKKRLIKAIESGWTNHYEENQLEKIYASYNRNKDSDLLEFAIEQTTYTSKDNRARLIIDNIKGSQLKSLPLSTKKKLIKELELGWTSDDDCNAIKAIYQSYQPDTDSALFEFALDQTDYSHIDNRAHLIIESLSMKQLKFLPFSTKKRLLKELEKGWTSGDETDSLKKLYKSYIPKNDADFIDYALEQTNYSKADNRSLDIVNSLTNDQIKNMPKRSQKKLIESLEDGWTTSKERTAINRIKDFQ